MPSTISAIRVDQNPSISVCWMQLQSPTAVHYCIWHGTSSTVVNAATATSIMLNYNEDNLFIQAETLGALPSISTMISIGILLLL